MSAIISDRAPIKTEAPAARPAKSSREEEFRSALDRYIANYRKHRLVADHAGRRDTALNFWPPKLANWSHR